MVNWRAVTCLELSPTLDLNQSDHARRILNISNQIEVACVSLNMNCDHYHLPEIHLNHQTASVQIVQ